MMNREKGRELDRTGKGVSFSIKVARVHQEGKGEA